MALAYAIMDVDGGGIVYFEYGEDAIAFLTKRDKLLGAAIERIGPVSRTVDSDLFSAVMHHIIGQQISAQAQATIWARFSERLQVIDADTVCSLPLGELQALGMTFRKAEYILDFAHKVKARDIDLVALEALPDHEVIRELSALKGIGVWTAEMILLFCLQRPDIVSYGDLAILRGMRMLYHHRSIDKKTFARYARRYSPYGSVASLYLWEIASGALPEMRDYAPKSKKGVPAK